MPCFRYFVYKHAVHSLFLARLLLTANVYFHVLRAFSSIINVLWLQSYCTESVPRTLKGRQQYMGKLSHSSGCVVLWSHVARSDIR